MIDRAAIEARLRAAAEGAGVTSPRWYHVILGLLASPFAKWLR